MERLIDRTELNALLDRHDDVRVVMALGPERYRSAHIPGSETFASLEAALAELDRDDEIVVYCSHEASPASRWAAHVLSAHGYERVRRYAGGLTDWVAAGLPLEGRMADEATAVGS